MTDRLLLSCSISRAAFSYLQSCALAYTSSDTTWRNCQELKMNVLCWLCSSYPWQLHRTKFLLHWPGLETKKVPTSYEAKKVPTAYVCFFLQCCSFVPSYKCCLKVLSLIPFAFLSLRLSSQICSRKDGPFQFPSVQVCTLGPSPYGWCHWLTYHLLQVRITFFKQLKVKVD